MLESADAAVEYARNVRALHRRRTERRSSQRTNDICIALDKLKEAMRPLRSEIGRFSMSRTLDPDDMEAIRERSRAIQSERRKLWKMLHPSERPKIHSVA